MYIFSRMKAVILLMAEVGIATGWASELLVEQVPASVLTSTNERPIMVTTTDAVAELPAADRWEKFEAEFGIQQPSQSLVKGSLQNAKYQLDRTSLVLQDFIAMVNDHLRFDYGLSDIGLAPRSHVATGNFLTDTLCKIRLKSDIRLKIGEKPFVGIKLELPLGD